MVHHQDHQEIRKGPWTEQEDVQLNFYVNLFGDRRWDFIAKVSGLKRTGKSCRLRWVNYMHPGLKRGKMSPQEEKLVLELHSKWGNRWSKIARKLPGRTDNEIKNYWRTHMRKKAQEKKKAMSTSSSLSSICSSSSSSCSPTTDFNTRADMKERNFYDTGGLDTINTNGNMTKNQEEESPAEVYSMDEIWKDIELSEEDIIKPVYDSFNEEGSSFSCTTIASPIWNYCPDTLWTMDDQSSTMFMPTNDDQFDSFHSTQEQNMFLIG